MGVFVRLSHFCPAAWQTVLAVKKNFLIPRTMEHGLQGKTGADHGNEEKPAEQWCYSQPYWNIPRQCGVQVKDAGRKGQNTSSTIFPSSIRLYSAWSVKVSLISPEIWVPLTLGASALTFKMGVITVSTPEGWS